MLSLQHVHQRKGRESWETMHSLINNASYVRRNYSPICDASSSSSFWPRWVFYWWHSISIFYVLLIMPLFECLSDGDRSHDSSKRQDWSLHVLCCNRLSARLDAFTYYTIYGRHHMICRWSAASGCHQLKKYHWFDAFSLLQKWASVFACCMHYGMPAQWNFWLK